MPDKKDDQPAVKVKKDSNLKPGTQSLHTTDPQENMEGPVSSVVQNVKDAVEDDETKEEADERKDRNM